MFTELQQRYVGHYCFFMLPATSFCSDGSVGQSRRSDGSVGQRLVFFGSCFFDGPGPCCLWV